MPASLSYPGVYIQELPSGVRTITGVATSITAFVGRALRGPAPTEAGGEDVPVTINSFAEFVRIFGGLWNESTLGFAVRDFFLNGGSQAIIVRVFRPGGGNARSVAELCWSGLTVQAVSPGAWGNSLRVRIDHKTRTTPAFAGEDTTFLFNLTVKDMLTGQVEIFRNVSVAIDHPRRVDKVLAKESSLVRCIQYNARPAAHQDPAGTDPDVFSDANPTSHSKVALGFEATDGNRLSRSEVSDPSLEAKKRGIYALLNADLFNLLCIPPHVPSSAESPTDVEIGLIDDATAFCKRRRAFFIIDPPFKSTKGTIKSFPGMLAASNYSAVFFPTLQQPNPLHDNQVEEFAPCGAVAGIMARTDVERGVWKAPAGLEATLVGVPQLSVTLGDADNGELNPLAINCLRAMPAAGRVVWGARTLEGADRLASEWKYIPVRRTALFIEESLYRGTQWAVFEPNDEPLWAQIRLNLGAFMHNLFRQGAFQGRSPREAYFVKCDGETTTQADINLGIVNIHVGFAPLKPAEFVVISIQQMAGQLEV